MSLFIIVIFNIIYFKLNTFKKLKAKRRKPENNGLVRGFDPKLLKPGRPSVADPEEGPGGRSNLKKC